MGIIVLWGIKIVVIIMIFTPFAIINLASLSKIYRKVKVWNVVYRNRHLPHYKETRTMKNE